MMMSSVVAADTTVVGPSSAIETMMSSVVAADTVVVDSSSAMDVS
jgi:hypothetical protein